MAGANLSFSLSKEFELCVQSREIPILNQLTNGTWNEICSRELLWDLNRHSTRAREPFYDSELWRRWRWTREWDLRTVRTLPSLESTVIVEKLVQISRSFFFRAFSVNQFLKAFPFHSIYLKSLSSYLSSTLQPSHQNCDCVDESEIM